MRLILPGSRPKDRDLFAMVPHLVCQSRGYHSPRTDYIGSSLRHLFGVTMAVRSRLLIASDRLVAAVPEAFRSAEGLLQLSIDVFLVSEHFLRGGVESERGNPVPFGRLPRNGEVPGRFLGVRIEFYWPQGASNRVKFTSALLR